MNSTDLEMLLRRVQSLGERLDNAATAHADEFAKLEKRCDWLEQELRAMGKTIDLHEADIQKLGAARP